VSNYYHFATVGEDGIPRLSYGDGREVRVGETLTVEGEPVLCEHGLHASARILDALRYAGGGSLALCRVTLGGTVLHDDDKSVATERTVVAMLDTTTTERLLREFARWCALSVAHLWDMPDVVRRYLETGDETIRDAASAAAWAAVRDAAWDAAWDAARDAARDAAWDAASAAARDAAWAAVRDAAWDAASAAAWAAVRDAAWAAVRDAAWDAARDAAWDAASAAARDAAWAAVRDAASAAARDAAWAAVRDAAWDAAWDAASAAVRDAAWDAASAAAWAAVRDAQNAQLEHMASEAMQIQGNWE